MIDYTELYEEIKRTPLEPWLKTIPSQVVKVIYRSTHGDLPTWLAVTRKLPKVKPAQIDLNTESVSVGAQSDCSPATREKIMRQLRQLAPWRKGPYTVHGIGIDSEWRSDLKWNRLVNHLQPLGERLVLDVGCGNGYHCWRAYGAGANLVIGIDPNLLYVMQFQAIRHFMPANHVHVLPLPLEAVPDNTNAFDTVFSMGVLCHRHSPIDHLTKLRSCLRTGGELALETLVAEGDRGTVLLPEGCYAKMQNVWFIPSCATLESWMKRCGFVNIRLIDVTRTTTDEQRRTDWMTFESLVDFLDPLNPDLTVEGLPAPKRAIFLANNP